MSPARSPSPSSRSLRERVERRAKYRCEYCHAPQNAVGYKMHIEHIIPFSQGGSEDMDNLALACASCNLAKGTKRTGVDPTTKEEVPLFHPRRNNWNEHFRWSRDHTQIEGITPIGGATVVALQLNSPIRQQARHYWSQAGLLP